MSFPREYEDKVVLNIVWAYFSKMITQGQMLDHLNRIDHTFKHLFDKDIVTTQQSKVGTTTKPGMATEKQINFIKGLGGEDYLYLDYENMTSREATTMIDELKARKNSRQTIPPVDLPPEETKKLTPEQIAEIGEDAFL